MTMVRYGISRNMPCVDAVTGEEKLMCLAIIEHENGMLQRHVIDEGLIRFAGEGVIEREVQEAATKGGVEYKTRTK